MVNHMNPALDSTFAALSDATRRGILAQLALGETSISELAAPYRMSLPAVSKHVRVLESAGLVTRRKDGRVHRCRLAAEPMKEAAEWIAFYRRFWEQQFNALDHYLAETTPEKENPWQAPNLSQTSNSKSGGRLPRRANGSSKPGRNPKR
ncbi:MAG TPA: metalloregulator ArsR/SmtB family transcription factor [Candidatus Acidoferrum sp.]|nr:metalloregulator ArsR/SmtB family transcription factor [Candidatus Acidoferrum sp.]